MQEIIFDNLPAAPVEILTGNSSLLAVIINLN